MRDLNDLNKYRFTAWEIDRYGPLLDDREKKKMGCFVLGHNGVELRCIADSGQGWDHVSVTCYDPKTKQRCPTWEEMDFIKRQFFYDHEVAMQYHPTVENHVSIHDFCLHLWRPRLLKIPKPPKSRI